MKNILLSLAILIGLNANAQEVKIKWGPESKGQATYNGIESVGWSKGNYFTSQSKFNNMAKRVYYLEKISSSLNLQFSKKLESKTYSASYIKIINDYVYMIQMKNDGLKMNKAILYYNKYNLNGDLMVSKDILEVENLYRFNQMFSNINYTTSPDGNTIGISFLNEWPKENYVKMVNIILDANDLNNYKVYEDQFSYNSEKLPEYLTLPEISITNNGSLVSMIAHKFDIDDPFHYEMKILNKDGQFNSPIDLKLDEFYLNQIQFTPYDDYVVFNGLYVVEQEKKNVAQGFFLAQLNIEENKIDNISSFPYSLEFFTSLGYKIKKDGTVKFGGYYDFEILPTSDGGGYLIADHKSGSYYSKGSFESVIIPFNKNLELSETMVLPKKNYGEKAHVNGYGYFAFLKEDILYMVYNDSEENIQNESFEDLEQMKNVDDKNVAVFLAEIQPGKQIKRQILFTYKDKGGYLLPPKCSKDDGKILINIADGKKLKYGLLNF